MARIVALYTPPAFIARAYSFPRELALTLNAPPCSVKHVPRKSGGVQVSRDPHTRLASSREQRVWCPVTKGWLASVISVILTTVREARFNFIAWEDKNIHPEKSHLFRCHRRLLRRSASYFVRLLNTLHDEFCSRWAYSRQRPHRVLRKAKCVLIGFTPGIDCMRR